jgi:hypothetical protein
MDFILPGVNLCTDHLYNNNFVANHSLRHLVTQKQYALYYVKFIINSCSWPKRVFHQRISKKAFIFN